ncbi:MAG: tyrosine-type recombinase/integrase [Candidatus Bathyarchaeia archaeon]
MKTLEDMFKDAGRLIAIDQFPLNYEALKPHLAEGCTLWVEAGPTGKRLKQPVQVRITPGASLRELDVISYVVTSLSCHKSSLIPWVLGSPAMVRLASYLRRYRTSSPGTLRIFATYIKRFCEWVNLKPEELVNRLQSPDPRDLREFTSSLRDYVGELQALGLTPSTVRVQVSAIRSLLKANEVEVPTVLLPRSRAVYEDRAPRPEELLRLLEAADLRGKAIISMLALGGFRLGTLAKLRYRHVKEDLERGIIPVHIHVEAEITKGKYGSYDTFIGAEAVEYLKLYLEQRRRGSPSGKIPPETIMDESPLIATAHNRRVRPLTRDSLTRIVENLFVKAGLRERCGSRRYRLRAHSIRKYFRTQLAALGVPADYIEYMMGHKISTYHDISMKGVDFLRNIYAASGLSIRPKTQVSRIEMLKEIIRAWGLNPEKILVREALEEPHRTILTPIEREEEQVKALAHSLREMLRRELLNTSE